MASGVASSSAWVTDCRSALVAEEGEGGSRLAPAGQEVGTEGTAEWRRRNRGRRRVSEDDKTWLCDL